MASIIPGILFRFSKYLVWHPNNHALSITLTRYHETAAN